MEFDDTTIRKLNALALVATRVRAGRVRGDRRSSKRGSSVEFADYRNYTHGDDIRQLDWNIYARLGKPFIRLFEEEEDLAVHLLLDDSRSMDWGEGSYHKFGYALRLAAAIGSIALVNGDQLSVHILGDNLGDPLFGPSRGSQHTLRYFQKLKSLRADRRTHLPTALSQFALRSYRPGLLFFVSDLLDPNGIEGILDGCLARGHEIVLIHLLSPDEITPNLAGDIKLIDREFGYTQDISLDPNLQRLYQKQLSAWIDQIRAHCRSRDIHYVRTSTGQAWEHFILQQLRREGIVR